MAIKHYSFTLVFTALLFSLAGAAGAAELPKDANTTCPVMMKEEVDPDLFVDYKGERVYLCCTKCKKRFNQDPEKYMKRIKDAKAANAKKPVAAASSAISSKPAPAAR